MSDFAAKPPELWMRVDENDGVYRWMVWEPGPMGSENAHWFDTREEADECVERLTK